MKKYSNVDTNTEDLAFIIIYFLNFVSFHLSHIKFFSSILIYSSLVIPFDEKILQLIGN